MGALFLRVKWISEQSHKVRKYLDQAQRAGQLRTLFDAASVTKFVFEGPLSSHFRGPDTQAERHVKASKRCRRLSRAPTSFLPLRCLEQWWPGRVHKTRADAHHFPQVLDRLTARRWWPTYREYRMSFSLRVSQGCQRHIYVHIHTY